MEFIGVFGLWRPTGDTISLGFEQFRLDGAGDSSGNRVFHNAHYGVSSSGSRAIAGNQIYNNLVGLEMSWPGVNQVANNLIYDSSNQGILAQGLARGWHGADRTRTAAPGC